MKGRVVARNLKTSMYKVSVINPNSHKRVQKWTSVESITSVSFQEEKVKRKEQEQKRKKRYHRKKFRIVLTIDYNFLEKALLLPLILQKMAIVSLARCVSP